MFVFSFVMPIKIVCVFFFLFYRVSYEITNSTSCISFFWCEKINGLPFGLKCYATPLGRIFSGVAIIRQCGVRCRHEMKVRQRQSLAVKYRALQCYVRYRRSASLRSASWCAVGATSHRSSVLDSPALSHGRERRFTFSNLKIFSPEVLHCGLWLFSAQPSFI